MIRVFITDDHVLMRSGLKKLLQDHDIVVCGEASTALDTLEYANHDPKFCDVLLLDIALPDKSGIDILRIIRHKIPALPVLILSMYPEDQYAVRVIREGASGYLTKESAPEQLVEAIHKVANGGKFITPKLAEKLADALGISQEIPAHELLSAREFQILQSIASGKSITEIANELFISVKTVSTYRSRLLEKLHLSKNSEITTYAHSYQLLPPK